MYYCKGSEFYQGDVCIGLFLSLKAQSIVFIKRTGVEIRNFEMAFLERISEIGMIITQIIPALQSQLVGCIRVTLLIFAMVTPF